jgi:hypothetical protein
VRSHNNKFESLIIKRSYLINLIKMSIFLVAEMGTTCNTSINPFEWMAIIGLITGAGIFSVSTGVAGYALVLTLVDMISSGASVQAIATAVSAPAATGAGNLEILTFIIVSIKNIIGC